MKIIKFVTVGLASLVLIIGCAPTKPILSGRRPSTKSDAKIVSKRIDEVSAQKIFELDLKIYPDESKGKRYDEYSAIVLQGRIATMIEDENGDIIVIDTGRVVIVGEKIDTILRNGEKFPPKPDSAEALFLNTNGIIFPGFINAHDHVHYNTVGIWDVPDKYTNRYQWPDDYRLRADVKFAKYLFFTKKYFYMPAEAMKYGEVKHLVGGATAVQGAPYGSGKFCDILIRNMDVCNYFGFRRMSPYVREVTEVDDDRIQRWLDDMNSGKLDALFFHIAEGTDQLAGDEFDFLVENGLGRKEVIIIHGTALDEEQIKYMGEHNMTLVWSPVSNLLLYGETADIPTFIENNVNICLGTDWSPSGGKNLLSEMKIAYQYDKSRWGGILDYEDIAKMVTCNPADAVGWTDYCGRIKPGLYADITVIDDPGGNPFEALVEATERDIALVFVGGDPLYGDSIFMARMKPGDFEYIQTTCGFTKCLDFTKQNVEFGEQSFHFVVNKLQEALNFDPQVIKNTFTDDRIKQYKNIEEYLNDKFPGYHPLKLDPIYPCMDTYYFDALRNSRNANLQFDIEEIYYKH